ncbi:hypothetical protein QVD17_08594 [Tagetes erecta]|uniref:Uncharacterized protein n=1 Tax=Tagetes erecta TaxID=13708 RepID=A0AAD8P4B8_TARER|nr:hypothetical protein QVD17_08594 [Tagetes erecta]
MKAKKVAICRWVPRLTMAHCCKDELVPFPFLYIINSQPTSTMTTKPSLSLLYTQIHTLSLSLSLSLFLSL